jgi:hypothetical protein
MIDVHIPTTDGRKLVLERYTEPLRLLLGELKLVVPELPPPKITASSQSPSCSADLGSLTLEISKA